MKKKAKKPAPRFGKCPKCGEIGVLTMHKRSDSKGNVLKVDCYYIHNLDKGREPAGRIKRRACNVGTLGSLEDLGLDTRVPLLDPLQ